MARGFSLHGSGNYTLAGCSAYVTGGHNVAISRGAMVSVSGGVFSKPGFGDSPDKGSFHIYANATGSLAISGINQHNASRGVFDEGSTCVIHGDALSRQFHHRHRHPSKSFDAVVQCAAPIAC